MAREAMTPSLLREIGTALWGPRWQSEAARHLPTEAASVAHAVRSVQRRASGDRPIPPEWRETLVRLLGDRAAALRALRKRLRS